MQFANFVCNTKAQILGGAGQATNFEWLAELLPLDSSLSCETVLVSITVRSPGRISFDLNFG